MDGRTYDGTQSAGFNGVDFFMVHAIEGSGWISVSFCELTSSCVVYDRFSLVLLTYMQTGLLHTAYLNRDQMTCCQFRIVNRCLHEPYLMLFNACIRLVLLIG